MNKKLLPKWGRITGIAFLVLLTPALLLLSRVNREPLQQKNFFREAQKKLQNLKAPSPDPGSRQVRAGWAQLNITPSFKAPLAGYGPRGPFESIHDSIALKIMVFQKGRNRPVAVVSPELLIFPPQVMKELPDYLKGTPLSVNRMYFSSTHTHSSYGGWSPKFAGQFIAGDYNPEIIRLLCSKIKQGVSRALKNIRPVETGYEKVNAAPFVKNRLIKDGATDPWIRLIKIRQENGKTAALCTFSAHPTYLPAHMHKLSGDYPGCLMKKLESHAGINTAIFCAGAMGSHTPIKTGNSGIKTIDNYADKLDSLIMQKWDSIPLKPLKKLLFFRKGFPLDNPHVRISENIRIRPWVFHCFMKSQDTTHIEILQLNQTVLTGLPADFSGELTASVEKEAKKRGFNLMITTFNGDFIGYVVPDKRYSIKKYETREMNWYGPHMGSYFSFLTKNLLEHLPAH